MDTVTAVLVAITDWDPTTIINLSTISNDVEAIEKKQGTMSEYGIKKYAEQYIVAAQKNHFDFLSAFEQTTIVDWSLDYTATGSDSVVAEYDGERALINQDMVITVPTGMKWSNRKSMIGQSRTLVFMSADGDDYRNPKCAEVFFEIGDPIQLAQPEPLDLSHPQLKSNLDRLIMAKLNSISINPIGSSDDDGMPMMGLSFKQPTELKADADWVISYTSCQGEDSPKLIFAIVNEINMYIGKLWTKTETNPAEIERMAASWLSSLDYCEDEEKEYEPGEWIVPVYTSNHKVIVDDEICVPVPDNMISSIDEKVDMSYRFCFVAVPNKYEDGLINYKYASIGIGMLNKQNVDEIKSLWESETPEKVADTIHGMLERNKLDENEMENYEEVLLQKGFMKSFAFDSEKEFDDGYYCKYVYFIFVGEHMYNGSFYFNVKREQSEYKSIVKEWLEHVDIHKFNLNNNENKKKQKPKQSTPKDPHERFLEDHAKWEKESDKIWEQRNKVTEERIAQKTKEIENTVKDQKAKELSDLQRELAEQKDRKEIAEKTLASLGFLKFSAKKEQRAIIEDAANRITSVTSSLESLDSRYSKILKEQLNTMESDVRSAVEEEYPIPHEPEDPTKPRSVDTEELKDMVSVVLYSGGSMTVTEICHELRDCYNIGASSLAVSSALRKLMLDGHVIREEYDHVARYSST